ncbi:MAG: phage capsid protein [Pseudomonadota bacterium]|nr:phage capsid protein [Pseudomonadota bacterium]
MTNTVAPFPTDPALTAIAIAFRNRRMVADRVLPRTPVGRQEFKYFQHTLSEGFTVPQTLVGRRGQPQQVEFTGQERTDSTEDHALDAPVPIADIENAPPGFDPLGHATEQTTNLIELGREVRVANTVFDESLYGANNKITLSGSDQWSDPAAPNPIRTITEALDSLVMRPNFGVLGRPVATALRTHPKVVKAFHGSLGDEGMVPLAWLAEQLELEELVIGESRINVAAPGQNVNLQRAWGPHASFSYRDTLAGTTGTTFGATAQWGGRIANKSFEKNIGMRGGWMVRVGESVKEFIAAPDLGFLFENAV